MLRKKARQHNTTEDKATQHNSVHVHAYICTCILHPAVRVTVIGWGVYVCVSVCVCYSTSRFSNNDRAIKTYNVHTQWHTIVKIRIFLE